MENDRGIEETWSDWDGGNRNMAVGALLGSVLVAGVVAYVVRRKRQEEEPMIASVSGRAAGAALTAINDERLVAGREFLSEKVLPEFKPALLALLREAEEVVEQAFRRAEKTIKDL
jgi:hypothetical protein